MLDFLAMCSDSVDYRLRVYGQFSANEGLLCTCLHLEHNFISFHVSPINRLGDSHTHANPEVAHKHFKICRNVD